MTITNPVPLEETFEVWRQFWRKELRPVPKENGGCQLEWHQNGWDIEIDFDAMGQITGVLVSKD